MEKYLIFIAASDGTGHTYSEVYLADNNDEKVIGACEWHFQKKHEYAGFLYTDRGSTVIIKVQGACNCVDATKIVAEYEQYLAEQEAEELSELARLKDKYPNA